MNRLAALTIGREAISVGFGAQIREDVATGECYLSVTNRAGRDRIVQSQQDWDDLKRFEVRT